MYSIEQTDYIREVFVNISFSSEDRVRKRILFFFFFYSQELSWTAVTVRLFVLGCPFYPRQETFIICICCLLFFPPHIYTGFAPLCNWKVSSTNPIVFPTCQIWNWGSKDSSEMFSITTFKPEIILRVAVMGFHRMSCPLHLKVCSVWDKNRWEWLIFGGNLESIAKPV